MGRSLHPSGRASGQRVADPGHSNCSARLPRCPACSCRRVPMSRVSVRVSALTWPPGPAGHRGAAPPAPHPRTTLGNTGAPHPRRRQSAHRPRARPRGCPDRSICTRPCWSGGFAEAEQSGADARGRGARSAPPGRSGNAQCRPGRRHLATCPFVAVKAAGMGFMVQPRSAASAGGH